MTRMITMTDGGEIIVTEEVDGEKFQSLYTLQRVYGYYTHNGEVHKWAEPTLAECKAARDKWKEQMGIISPAE